MAEKELKNIIRRKNGCYGVTKTINKKHYFFGYYPTLETALKVRDRLIEVDWDREQYQNIRDELRAKGIEL